MYNIKITMGDITKSDCECIVNAANNSLLGGGGVDGAIHRAAGSGLLKECLTLGGCRTGEAKITKGYNLKACHIIHTVGPVYHGREEDAELLKNCYTNSLELAKQNCIHSISFPAISTGAYGYPLKEAIFIALNSVFEWLNNNSKYDITVEFCCFDEDTYSYYKGIYGTMTKSYEQQEKEFAEFIETNKVKIKDAMEMRLADEPFEKIKSGEKTVEIRLYDKKRKHIKAGDKIIFYRLSDKTDSITATVKAVHRFDTFIELFSSDLFPKTGCSGLTVERATESMYKYYSKQQEQQYGVLGIEIEEVLL